MNSFNGQVNISRDLRQNKQTVIFKRDLQDILFLVLGIGTLIALSYILGFKYKVIDEFSSILIGMIPMVIILTLGFKRKAGIRYIYFLRIKMINKCSASRKNIAPLNKIIEIKKEKNPAKVVSKIDINEFIKNNVNSIKEVIKKIGKRKPINIGNKTVTTIIVNKNDKPKKNKYIIDKFILVVKCNESEYKHIIEKYKKLEQVKNISIRLKNDIVIVLFEINYSYKNFLNIYTFNELKDIGNNEKFIKKLKLKVKYLLFERKKYFNKYIKFLNIRKFDKKFIPSVLYDFYDLVEIDNLIIIDINDNYIKELDLKTKIVYMLHLYKQDTLKDFINEIKEVVEVIIYEKEAMSNLYLSIFLCFDNNEATISEVKNISSKYNVILNTLNKEKGLALATCSYNMRNPYNSYRLYKGIE